ncbi:hypothetical protein NE237_001655 [Protea cynaroides]|uniref:Uncharacterized protein n=1 Tax=Protea cynaroides TaxID=273540 RepID=A0A9Q0KTX5_9MAGN|nr:hypothetical protein NE237_001655 [Protea cynaroides]
MWGVDDLKIALILSRLVVLGLRIRMYVEEGQMWWVRQQMLGWFLRFNLCLLRFLRNVQWRCLETANRFLGGVWPLPKGGSLLPGDGVAVSQPGLVGVAAFQLQGGVDGALGAGVNLVAERVSQAAGFGSTMSSGGYGGGIIFGKSGVDHGQF